MKTKTKLQSNNLFKGLTLLVPIFTMLGFLASVEDNVDEAVPQQIATTFPTGDSCTPYTAFEANRSINNDVFVNCGGFLP